MPEDNDMKPVVFLHGWAQSRQAWYQQREVFPDALYLNLPGHGGAVDHPVEDWLEVIAGQLPAEPCVLVGWSLGGTLALALAGCFPERIGALALVASTPCFRRQDDWQAGCDEQAFAAFESAISSGSVRSLNRFFALMLHGDELSRSDYNRLAKQAVDREHSSSAAGLDGGLALLGSLDVRQSVTDISVPSLILHGEQAAIVSVDAGRWLAASIADSQLEQFQNCGHAPFLTQADTFNKLLFNWWNAL